LDFLKDLRISEGHAPRFLFMELLLNLAWLLLALPAYWLWRRAAGSRPKTGARSVECLLALGCVLVLLFPVISASDDLHAMRAEMEDSSVSKRSVGQTSSARHSAAVNGLQGPAGLMALGPRLAVPEIGLQEVRVTKVSLLSRPAVSYAGRAPPAAFLS
jgi:hypothetical protein